MAAPAAALLAFLAAVPGGAGARELSRAFAGVTLGVSTTDVRQVFLSSDAARLAEEPLLKGELLWSLSPAPEGAERLLARFRGGTLWEIEVLYPPAKKPRPWAVVIDEPSERYGLAVHSRETLPAMNETRAEWSDERTRLAYIRRERPGGTQDLVRLDDIASLSGVNADALLGAAPPEAPKGCGGFEACLAEGTSKYAELDCASAVEAWDRATVLNPADPRPYYYRSVVLKIVGREAESRAEFGRAELIDPSVRERGDGLGGPKVQADRACRTRPKAPAP